VRVFQDSHHPERGSSGFSAPWLALVGFVGLCLLVGAADAAVTQPAMRGWYLSLAAPPGTPPRWVFAPICTVIYVLVGTAAWLAWGAPGHRRALRLWGWQLLVNALWAPCFFGLHAPAAACVIIVALLALITATTVAFLRLSAAAGVLLFPYLLWTCYATYLNAGFWLLNPA
jgi:translocator protein